MNNKLDCSTDLPGFVGSRLDFKNTRQNLEPARHLLSRPSGTLSSAAGGGEGWGEEALWWCAGSQSRQFFREKYSNQEFL